MRIAYLTQSYSPMVSGAAIFAEQLAKEMAKRGHQVLVIAASEKEQPYIVQEENLTVLRLASIHNPMRVGQRFLLYPRRAVLQALQEFCPDVIHTHDPLQMGSLGIKYAQRVNIPVTLTTHQLPWFVAKYLPDVLGVRKLTEVILWKYATWLLQRFTAVITPTRTISGIVTQKTGIETKTIGYGIDLTIFHPHLSPDDEAGMRAKLNLPSCVPILLHVGRLDTDKYVDRVIMAAAQVISQTDAHLLIIGDGRQKPALTNLCKSMGIEKRVHFPGYISTKQGLHEIYRMANLFVTASEIETQGIVLLEAAASGLPIVAVHATCIPEIVHDEVNGYLIEPNNIDAMSEAMKKILKDSGIAKSMAKESRKLAETHEPQVTFYEHEKQYNLMLRKVREQLTLQKSWVARKWWKRLKARVNFSR